MELTERDKQRFEDNPSRFIEEIIKSHAINSPKNRLPAFNNSPIFDEPLVGFSDGDDPLFQQYKKIIGDFHLTPREALDMHLNSKGEAVDRKYAHLSVIAWILPIVYETRLGMRQESRFPSLRWNHTRWYGEELNVEVGQYLVSLLEKLGHKALDPMNSDFFKRVELPNGTASNWSQRHIAYACGLGTFSLSDGFITPRGIAHRCGSVVVSTSLPPTPRTYENHLSNCLFYRDKSCRRCIERCPAGAISEQGHDKRKCLQFFDDQKDLLRQLGRDKGYIGRYAGCGLCQTKVPCEDRIPTSARLKRTPKHEG